MSISNERYIEKGKPFARMGPMHHTGCMAMNLIWFMDKTIGSLYQGIASCQYEK